MDISGERETQMTESLISKVKELINKGNAEEALSLLQSQVEQGDGYAMYCLGRCYEEGWGVEQNGEKALLWYGKAWEAPDTEEIKGKIANGAGNVYFHGILPIELDFQEAARWYRKSAEKGYDWGYSNWGSCFAWGIGERKDTEKALELYKKAYEQHGEAAGITANHIGHIYQGETGENRTIERLCPGSESRQKQDIPGACTIWPLPVKPDWERNWIWKRHFTRITM